MTEYEKPSTMKPVKATIYYAEPDADPSVFERCLIRPEGGFLVINDLTKKQPRIGHLIPAHAVDAATCEEVE